MRPYRSVRRRDGRGQAALLLVVLLTIIISVFGGILAETTIQHDPIVQTDTIEHFTYRALEAGINTFMSKANDNPNLIACNSASPTAGQCKNSLYQRWKQVTSNTPTTPVPEYYAWGDPRFCHTELCPAPTTLTSTPVLYVKEAVYGAAGYGSRMFYQSSTVNVKPVNGFLTHVWWSKYEATDPANVGAPTTSCTYNYANGYGGPNTTGTYICSPVVFAHGTQVYGPIFSDDSIYVTYSSGGPTLGPVTTADPGCLFVGPSGGGCTTLAAQESTPVVSQTAAALAADHQGAAFFETPPTYDTKLGTYAHLDGCVYSGPTTIHFKSGDRMTVWSPDTPATATCPSTNKTGAPTTSNTAPVPNGTAGNGVIYVQTAPTGDCHPGANPYDAYDAASGSNGSAAQYLDAGGTIHAAYLGAGTAPDCEGDVFVGDTPTSGGVTGQLTVAAANDVIVTGTLKYTDCGTAFSSTKTYPCVLNTTGKSNDSLGLIAKNYVLVNHPVTGCSLSSGGGYFYGSFTPTDCQPTNGALSLAGACSVTALETPAAALCDPAKVAAATPTGITIDAAVLALTHSFAVSNFSLCTSSYGGCSTGTLKVYGSINQKWRGAIGRTTGRGFVKNYDWNQEGAIITPPYYLSPGTASWAVGSSAITNDNGPPKWCYATSTRSMGLAPTHTTTPACNP